MATRLPPDPELLDQVLDASEEQTEGETVALARREVIERRAQSNLVGYFGQAEWDGSVDYKTDRR